MPFHFPLFSLPLQRLSFYRAHLTVVQQNVIAPIAVDARNGTEGLFLGPCLGFAQELAGNEDDGNGGSLFLGLLHGSDDLELEGLSFQVVEVNVHVEEGSQD